MQGYYKFKQIENTIKSDVFVSLCSEVNSGFFYKSAEEREKLVKAERAFTDSKVQKIIDLKKQVCDAGDKGDGKKKGFIVINMKVLVCCC